MSSFMTQPTLTTFIGARNRRIDAVRQRLRNDCLSRDVVASFSSARHHCDGANLLDGAIECEPVTTLLAASTDAAAVTSVLTTLC